jgi:hypothetical protein
MFVHRGVHRRRDHDRNRRCERGVGEQVVGDAVCELGERIRRRRNDREHVRIAHERDVRYLLLLVPERRVHAIARERREGQRRQKALRLVGEDDVDVGAVLHERAGEGGGFIGRDAPAHAQ